MEKNDSIDFFILSEVMNKTEADIIRLRLRKFGAGKALLEEWYGSTQEMKEKVTSFSERTAKKLGICGDGWIFNSDDYWFGEFDMVGLLVKEFVSIDDISIITWRNIWDAYPMIVDACFQIL